MMPRIEITCCKKEKSSLPKDDGSGWTSKGRRRRQANCSNSPGSEMDRFVVCCKIPIGVMDGWSDGVGRSNMTDIFSQASHALP